MVKLAKAGSGLNSFLNKQPQVRKYGYLDKPQTFYFARIKEYNKFINIYKEYRKVFEILEI